MFVTEDYETAKRVLIDELERHADWLDEMGLHDHANEVSLVAEDVNLLGVGNEWSDTFASSDSDHDLGIAFWLVVTDEAPEDDE